jgi:general secretion pathway protein I
MKRLHSSAAAGFTLLEVMVALAVIAIALAAVIQATAMQADHVGYLRDKTFAHWVAMNQLALARWRPPPPGEQSGSAAQAGREWHWKMAVTTTPDPDLRRIDIEVREHPGDREPLAVLTGFVGKDGGAI